MCEFSVVGSFVVDSNYNVELLVESFSRQHNSTLLITDKKWSHSFTWYALMIFNIWQITSRSVRIKAFLSIFQRLFAEKCINVLRTLHFGRCAFQKIWFINNSIETIKWSREKGDHRQVILEIVHNMRKIQ